MARRLSKQAGLLAALTAIPFLCLAQQKPLAIPLVPAADWRQVEAESLPLSAVSKYGGEPVIEQEYGVKALELRTYQLGKIRTQVVVELAPDATAAYGLLTFYHRPSMLPEGGIELAYGDADGALMARGKNFIRFLRGQDSPLSKNDYQALLIFVGGTKPSAHALANLPAPLPTKNLVPESEKYFLGPEAAKRVLPSFRTDLLGFEQGAEVQLGQYQTGKGLSTLMAISYPTPQIARVRFGALTSFLGLNQDRGVDSIYGRRRGSFVFLVLGAGNVQTATLLMDQLRVAQGVSWDERYPSDRSFTLQLIQMILAIIILSAFLIAACALAGIIFFLSRRLAARFFPDWQWGHPDEDQLIRLNLKM
jgi:hypothetical protein